MSAPVPSPAVNGPPDANAERRPYNDAHGKRLTYPDAHSK